MNSPDDCEHDFRLVFPHHVTDQQPTGGERVMFVLCCGCGRSPIYFEQLGRELPRDTRAKGGWPPELRITNLYWDRGEGPSVEFVERQNA